MKTRTVLYADDGMILTDGENYGKCIYLSENTDADKYYEITEEEYQQLMETTEAEGVPDVPEITEDEYEKLVEDTEDTPHEEEIIEIVEGTE